MDERTLSINAIAKKIALLTEAMKNMAQVMDLSADDLQAFERYTENQHTVGPILDPTGYRDLLYSKGFEKLEKRLKLIRALLEVIEAEE